MGEGLLSECYVTKSISLNVTSCYIGGGGQDGNFSVTYFLNALL